jgi:hypothetical protein
VNLSENVEVGQLPERSKITADWGLAVVNDKRLRQLHAYWKKLCGDRRMPSREDVDPLDIPGLLPIVFLVEVLDHPLDFRFRLAGTHFCEFAGEEVSGKLIGQIFPRDFCAEVWTHWASCVEQKQPKSAFGQLWVPGRDYIHWEGIVLPLSPDGIAVNMFLGGCIFTSSVTREPAQSDQDRSKSDAKSSLTADCPD